mgnify:CR=1 FL=1
MLKSATFLIGILLAVGAFIGYLLLGNFLAPPPATVVVALRDIPPYTPLDANMLGVDAQQLNSQVLQTLVQKNELDEYLGGFVTTPIFAGEPLRKSAIVMAGNPLASKRLALALTDSNRVAAVIPVNAETSPSQIVTGDYVDLVISMAPGNLASNNSNNFGEILSGQDSSQASFGFGPSAVITPTQSTFQSSFILSSGIISAPLSGEIMNLPVTKAVIRSVAVLAVSFEQSPNPTYASAGFGEDSSAPPQTAFVEGEIKSITVSIPRDSAELLNFGIDNGKVHVLLLPLEQGQNEFTAQKNNSTLGVSWNDVLAFMIRERQELAASFVPSTANNAVVSPTNVATINPIIAPTDTFATPAILATPTPERTATQVGALAVPTAISGILNGNGSSSPNQLSTGIDLMAIVIPLACGFLFLIFAIIVIRVVRRRRMSHVAP